MLEDMCLEMSGAGHGDIREPFVSLVYPDGSRSVDFLYEKSTLSNQKEPLQTLPCAYTENGKTEHLIVELRDGALVMELHYTVYPACDVITRSAVLLNEGDTVQVERLMSMQLDMPFGGAAVTSFHGAWGREMNRHTAVLPVGKLVLESRTGCSSNRVNPFFMVHSPDANEASGSVYGFNLIYSGNHYAAAEVNAYGKTRIVSGIQPEGFRWLLEKDGRFETPEAVMTYSENGFTGQSQNMHRFVRSHIVRGVWRDRPRPVLLNSWEACYFNINEKSLVSMARSAKDLGVELLVMDDGWFGERDNDSRSLGDWTPSAKKLPGGLRSLAEKVIAEGLQFGIWVEPEMVNTDSRLYRKHPDWAMAIPGKRHSEGRTQRVLDLANPEVQDFLIQKMSEVFSSAPVSYVKWDMNRIFSDVASPTFSLRAAPPAATALTSACSAGFRRSGAATTPTPSAAPIFRRATATAIRSPASARMSAQAPTTRPCAERRLRRALPWRHSVRSAMNAMCATCLRRKNKPSASRSPSTKSGARSCSSAISTASPRATCTAGRAFLPTNRERSSSCCRS